MSAIAGIWSFKGGGNAAGDCQRMLAALRMYGRGDTAQYSGARVAVGRCLSPLLPEDRFDRQPLSGDGVTALVADLRLDNRQELARQLNLVDPSTMADAEFLLAAWQRWGDQCVHHLLGAFSFAVWNEPRQQLFLARDPAGERPLYYACSESSFLFSSLPKGLHALSFPGAHIDEDYVADYLAGIEIPLERTIFRKIVRLPAGCTLSVRPGRTKLRRYWDAGDLHELHLRSDEEYLELFRELFDSAVRARLRTVGSIGAHLSGGLDSSSVAATAARLLAKEGRQLIAYTAVPSAGYPAESGPDHFEDEGPAAAEVAALYPNMRHVLVDSNRGNFLDAIDLINRLYDHPTATSSNEVWAAEIMQRAKQAGITAVLNGYWGNATISGYGLEALSVWFRSGHWLTLARVAWQLRAAQSTSFKSMVRHALWPSLPFWIRKSTDPHLRGFSMERCIAHPEIVRARDLERRALRGLIEDPDEGRPLLRNVLRSVDVSDVTAAAQAGWGVDFRDPTWDKRIIEFSLTLPLEQFLKGGKLRSLVRRGMEGRLPPSTLNRRARGLQSADWYYGLTPLRGRMLRELDALEASPLASRLIDLARMRSLIDHWPETYSSKSNLRSSLQFPLSLGFSVGKFLLQYDPDAPAPTPESSSSLSRS